VKEGPIEGGLIRKVDISYEDVDADVHDHKKGLQV
jgi:hypothetical protein